MKFIEMSGVTLLMLLQEGEAKPEDLKNAGVTDESIVRVNHEGDIELRRPSRWDVIGGLLGDFEHRLKKATGLDWAHEEEQN